MANYSPISYVPIDNHNNLKQLIPGDTQLVDAYYVSSNINILSYNINKAITYVNDVSKEISSYINTTSANLTTKINNVKDSSVKSSDIANIINESNDSVIVGTIIAFAGNNPPNDSYLLCDGSRIGTISGDIITTDYPELFNILSSNSNFISTNSEEQPEPVISVSSICVPDLKDRFIQGKSNNTNIGDKKEAGLPNITGSFSAANRLSTTPTAISGAFSETIEFRNAFTSDFTNDQCVRTTYMFDAHQSNAIYGVSETVQPPALILGYYIKAK